MKQPADFVCDQMQTFLDKAIPDAKLTQQAYEKARKKYLVIIAKRLCGRLRLSPLCPSFNLYSALPFLIFCLS